MTFYETALIIKDKISLLPRPFNNIYYLVPVLPFRAIHNRSASHLQNKTYLILCEQWWSHTSNNTATFELLLIKQRISHSLQLSWGVIRVYAICFLVQVIPECPCSPSGLYCQSSSSPSCLPLPIVVCHIQDCYFSEEWLPSAFWTSKISK